MGHLAMTDGDVVTMTDKARARRGYLGLAETCDLASSGNVVLDPWSVLISRYAAIGRDNIFHPNVTVDCAPEGRCVVGSANKFFPGTFFVVVAGGQIEIGDGNEFGDGGCAVKANRSASLVRVGSGGRYLSGAQVMGCSTLGSGSQIIGPITVQDCTLAAGGAYRTADPDDRGAVLKGSGLARGLHVGVGEVVNGAGAFSADMIERQSHYH
jgi:bifunctional N-acetylglucosamine-1-phosphate-uridyltransferase/glucosamine-1-phosphate-acetyltransferase GlmU-like protein